MRQFRPETTVLGHLADGLPVLRANIGAAARGRADAGDGRPRRGDHGRHRLRRGAPRGRRARRRGAVDPARLLALVYQRDQDGVRQLATDHALVVDMLWLLGDLVVAPIVHLQQRAALRDGEPDSPVREALERWDQGYCPACGSWPALAEFFFGERLLRCAFCACTWRQAVDQCAYCDETRRALHDRRPRPPAAGTPHRAVPGLRRIPQDVGCRAGHAVSAGRDRGPGQLRSGPGGAASRVQAVAAEEDRRVRDDTGDKEIRRSTRATPAAERPVGETSAAAGMRASGFRRLSFLWPCSPHCRGFAAGRTGS